jgi:hypothetical protein
MNQNVRIAVTGINMIEACVEDGSTVEIGAGRVREQLDLLTNDSAFRSSKRSVAFLRYVVNQTLNGSADQLKERTIGVEVFEREPSYDTNLDHVVRTAATELRKRLAIYYGEEKHRSELRIGLVPGSYVPRFILPGVARSPIESEFVSETAFPTHSVVRVDPPDLTLPKANSPQPPHGIRRPVFRVAFAVAALCLLLAIVAFGWLRHESTRNLFWKPVLDTPGSVLLAVGDVPNGPPISSSAGFDGDSSMPVLSATRSPTVPFADAVTIARVVGTLQANGKNVVIRRESASSFSDLREGPVVLVGAFNNEWSLRLTHSLRYSLALDAEKRLIYIKDLKNPSSRSWSWRTDQPTDHRIGAGSPVFKDYALISRIRNSETGHVVVVIGGLYTYGTQAAGEFLTDPQLIRTVAQAALLDSTNKNLQIVLETTVTDETPGPPKIVAISVE